jgi:hypothetical protein
VQDCHPVCKSFTLADFDECVVERVTADTKCHSSMLHCDNDDSGHLSEQAREWQPGQSLIAVADVPDKASERALSGV